MLTLDNNFKKLSSVIAISLMISLFILVLYLRIIHKKTLLDVINDVTTES